MSLINTLPLGSGFSATNGGFDLERSPGNALAQSLASIDLGHDRVRLEPHVRPFPADNSSLVPGPGGGWGFGGGDQGGFAGLGGILTALLNQMTNIFAQLASLLRTSNGGQAPWNGTGGEQAFANASASSTGDPHETFDATSSTGERVGGKWDSMTSHQNLLSSDSFEGGYRVSNTVTAPNANGVTLNAHVGVATDGGQTSLGMNADGSYDVSSFGRRVDLVRGQAVRLNKDESVTLNADRSLTIVENNAARGGGSIATTLRSNGSGGVDVTNRAQNVDLGGYLVSKSDGDTDPVALAGPEYGSPTSGGWNTTYPIVGSMHPDLPTFQSAPVLADPSFMNPSDPNVQLAATSFDTSDATQPYEIEEA